jgi:uncharacterized protein (DUF1499 family)
VRPSPLELRSRLAGWSAYLGVLAIPVLIIAAVGHRAGLMDVTSTYSVMAVGFLLAAGAVLAAIVAFVAIWRDGSRGTARALAGLVVGLAVLAMPAIGAWDVVTLPRLTDVSTDPANPPVLSAAVRDRSAQDAPIVGPDAISVAAQRQAYPDVVPRHYPVSTARVYLEARTIVDQRGWRVLSDVPPSDDDPSATIEAVAQTVVFGFRQDVAIRIMAEGDGSRVDMRSASRSTAHDLGANAGRVRRFFRDLDAALQGVTGS